MKLEPPHRQVCADAEPILLPRESFVIPNPLIRRTWTDSDGIVWHRRGDSDLSYREMVKLAARLEVLLMHVYDGHVHLHEGPDRDGLLQEVHQNLVKSDDPMHEFDFGEFRDEARNRMVLIVEHC